MSAKKQYGKGLSGFMLGLLLATVVIAGILFFLNQSNKKTFKEPERPAAPPVPEVLTPKDAPASIPELPASGGWSASEPEEDVLGQFIEEQAASDTTDITKQEDKPIAVSPSKPTGTTKPKTEKTVRDTVKAEPKKQAEKVEKKAETKPTPEQILNSGSIEKARKDAQAQVKKPSADQSGTGNRVIVQMGSFNNQAAAEAQRAKLAMMGVSASIVQGTVNGKTVYRVQSGRLSQAEAARVQNTLRQNGVDSFSRTAK
ncbi:hypothetical protein PL75_02015 [Neisseria arctica]|uniref:SPOR domain-containing protein n=1 Tax=Neisseria arctica TaxID=1470200 RepID=A0A0J0YUJ1_9NEIS|nr:SPOR domain-containing protein [Neisseria arctica]KLT73770.1 hypothetical protein PL75_02015 [Neisseria arctica]UOO85874.1 SPOR domain-containing protein [Neisseria arctica]